MSVIIVSQIKMKKVYGQRYDSLQGNSFQIDIQ